MQERIGILLVNLGSPDSPDTGDVRRYLKEFLLDWRVIDIPPVPRNLLVRGIIAPFRAPKSGAAYRKIWTADGSPLIHITRQLAELAQAKLGPQFQVEMAMRYQNPSIASALEKFRKDLPAKLKVISLYPQYASSTVGSVHQEVMRVLSTWQTIPHLEFVNSYPLHPGLIDAFVARAAEHQVEAYDHVLFSFHGLPERQLTKADTHDHCIRQADCCAKLSPQNAYCYSAQCHATAQAIAGRLGLSQQQYTICYQSRLGKTPWKRPYTSDVLHEMAQQGKKRLLVFSPAFVADCLETIYEIGMEYQEEFEKMGGEKITLVEGLNTHPIWVDAVCDLCRS
jgi:ferrochelatase